MDRRSQPTILPQGLVPKPGRRSDLVLFALIFGITTATLAPAQTRAVIALPAGASTVEKVAANELATDLHALYPSTKFEIGAPAAAVPVIYLGTAGELPAKYALQVKGKLTQPESFVVETASNGASKVAVIAGASPSATLFAVDSLLEKLGFGFYLSYNTTPPHSQSSFSFAGWDINDAPIAGERVIFNWHNFLSGCSTWNLEDWQHWVTQASRMRFNTIMVHAYGNNPMFSFSFNGQTKPTGYLSNTKTGRDWGTEDVLDVRKIVAGEEFFKAPVFGADASQVGENDEVAAATSLMQNVFRFAADQGMGVTFALDVDSAAANPQNLIATLPASARFDSHGFQLADPDTAEGYTYYRAEIEQLMKLYPEITQVALWFRSGPSSPWTTLHPDDFPVAWREEFRAALEANPSIKKDPLAPSMFAFGKIARAFRKALDETGHGSVTLAAGTWDFPYVPAADVFMPPNVALMPLDSGYELPSDPFEESLRSAGRHRPIVPIIWAQHDDREYAGRSYTPFAGLASILRWSNSAGYGVIHWTTRPLDLFFKNVADQVWAGSENETLDVTASEMAKRTFGNKPQELGKRYLLDWIYDAPAFGQESSDQFNNRNHALDAENEASGARARLALLAQMRPLAADAGARDWIGYFEDWEGYAQQVFAAQSALQESYAALESGNNALARRLISAATPESAIEQYARAIRHGVTSPGEKGILISLNLRWLPYFEAMRQEVGLEPLRVEFAPTFHDPVAQQPGRFTFDFDAEHRPIEVLGSSELGTDVGMFKAGGQCPSGIEVSAPVTIAIGGLAGTRLPDGTWRMKLEMPETARVAIDVAGNRREITSASEIEVQANDGKVRFTLSPVAGPARVCRANLSTAQENE